MNPGDSNQYLEQEVLSANPMQLRLMLIKRASELCSLVDFMWKNDQVIEAQQWVLRIREILGELLSGVQDRENPISHSVSDFYLFMLQLLGEVDDDRDADKLATLKELLEIEAETWSQVIQQNLGGTEQDSSSVGNELSVSDFPNASAPRVDQGSEIVPKPPQAAIAAPKLDGLSTSSLSLEI